VELIQLLKQINPWYKAAGSTPRRAYIGFATLLAASTALRKNVLPTTIESIREYVGVNPWFA
jgi:hypothetical protein